MIMIKLVVTVLVFVAIYLAASLAAKVFASTSEALYWVLVKTGIKKKEDADLSMVERPLFYMMEKSAHVAAKKETQIHSNMAAMYALDADKAQRLDAILGKVFTDRKPKLNK